jgi:phosphatidylserine/phosphatidylglycerophosphate/cardiolipin synthase-like enzyme
MVGDIQHSPKNTWKSTATHDPIKGDSNWLPTNMTYLLSQTQVWCDFMSLAPPNGLFLSQIKDALHIIANRCKVSGNKIVIRFMFGNVITVPVNCTSLIQELTKHLPDISNLHIYVGAWRKGMTWNHAKVIAIDGKMLYTGGHNLWDNVYLDVDPIHDTSIRLEGDVALVAHRYANEQWSFIQRDQSSIKGKIVNLLPDRWGLPLVTRVTISEYPEHFAETFAPLFKEELILKPTLVDDSTTNLDDDDNDDSARDNKDNNDKDTNKDNNKNNEIDKNKDKLLPIITLGRYGNIIPKARSSDDAFIAMFDAANKIIRFLLQDLGPVNKEILGKKVSYMGWPKAYLSAMGRAIWLRNVTIEIVLSNPTSGEDRGNYSNGWSCAEVAAEIIKTIQEQFPNDATDQECRKKIEHNLRICFLKVSSGSTWRSKNKVGLHSKVFIIDDVCTYIGSQNLYLFDLAEWGVAIDDVDATAKIIETLWMPMWSNSYYKHDGDCNVDDVMDALMIDRDPKVGVVVPDREIVRLESGINLTSMKNSKFHYDGDDHDQRKNMVWYGIELIVIYLVIVVGQSIIVGMRKDI